MPRLAARLLAAVPAMLVSAASLGAPGELDPAFGQGGIFKFDTGSPASLRIGATARQPDGKLLIAGAAPSWNGDRGLVAVTRLHGDGTRDLAFGTQGWATLTAALVGLQTEVRALAVDHLGRIVIVVATGDGIALGRLLPDGTRDDFFAPNHGILFDYWSSELRLQPRALSIGPGGNYYVAGEVPPLYGGYKDTFVAAYDTSGQRLNGFGNNGPGFARYSVGTADDEGLAIKADSNVIYVGGYTSEAGGGKDAFVMALDTGGWTRATTVFDHAGQDDVVTSIELDWGGRATVGGRTAAANAAGQFLVARVYEYGGLDTSFGTQGKTVMPLAMAGTVYDGDLRALLMKPASAEWLLAGTARHQGTGDTSAVVAKLDWNGNPVPWGENGVVFGPQTADADDVRGIYPREGHYDEFLLAGARTAGAMERAAAFRLVEWWQQFDANFGSEGATSHAWIQPLYEQALAIQRNAVGQLLVLLRQNYSDTALARFHAHGEVDAGFADGGVKRLSSSDYPATPVALAIDGSDRPVIAGAYGPSEFLVARLLPGGELDPSWNGGIHARIAAGAAASAVAVDGAGRVVVVGQAYISRSQGRLVVARLLANGALDPAFNGSGIAAFDTPGPVSAFAVTFQADGKLLVAGHLAYQAIVWRLTDDGALDTQWGNAGLAGIPYPVRSWWNAVAVSGSRVYAGGVCHQSDSEWSKKNFCAAAFTPQGALDDGFGIRTFMLSPMDDEAVDLELSPDGRVLLAGDSYRTSEFRAIAINADGSQDLGYGSRGVAMSGVTGIAAKATIAGDGKLLLLGETVDYDLVMVQWQETADNIPDPFSFADKDNVPAGQLIVSDPVTITGLAAPAGVYPEGGEFSVGCNGTFQQATGTISNNQTICVRHWSSSYSGEAATSWITIGGVRSTFTVRTGQLPTTQIVAPFPSDPSNVATPALHFRSDDASATFQCSIDGGPYGACSSPWSGTLGEGRHQFRVRAVNAIGADREPPSFSWTIDLTPPDTTITDGPSAVTAGSATFRFSGYGTYQCRLDSDPFAACSSPVTYTELAHGSHTFEVRSVDPAGNVDPTPAVRTFEVDRVAPETTIPSGPPPRTNAPSFTLVFASDDPAATFECETAPGAYYGCTTPYVGNSSLVPDGTYTFRVRARDAVGNVDATPASWTFTLDRTAPETAIDSGPSGTTSSGSATLAFSAGEPGATFQCRMDGGAFAPCTSPVTYSGLSDGAHTFEVRAADDLGNADATPAARSWTVDATAPETQIDSGPTGTVGSASAAFQFTSPDAGATFECSLDGAAFSACTSGISYTGLPEGMHMFEVRARDAAGNVDATPASRTWSIDTSNPNTTITSGPDAVTMQTSATLAFQSSEGGSFHCSLDGAAAQPCTSPASYSGLAPGGHTFAVYAVDYAGNADASPATWSWAIDTTAPETSITSAPPPVTNQPGATIVFASPDAGATFECSLDGAPFAACASPVSFSGLANATHTFQVRGKDAAGNVDPTPASASWTVDTIAPDASISSAPAAVTNATSATFAFAANEVGASFECRLDGAAFAACSSPRSFPGLVNGSHTFQVRASDAAGNVDATPATYTWVVDTTAPDTTVVSGPSGNNNPDTATFTFASTEGGGSFECKLDAGAFVACASGATYPGLAKGEHTFQVRALDAAGNVDATPATRTWRVR